MLDVKPGEGIELPIVTRIAQAPTTVRNDLKAGDLVSVYRFKALELHTATLQVRASPYDSELASAEIVNVNVFAVDATATGDNILKQSG